MTPPKESSVDSAQGNDQPLQSESSRDLFQELKNLRRQDNIYDDGDRKVHIDPADQSDLSLRERPPQEIPVTIRTKANEQAKANLDAFFGVGVEPTNDSESDLHAPVPVAERLVRDAPVDEPRRSAVERARGVVSRATEYAKDVKRARIDEREERAISREFADRDKDFDEFDSAMDDLRGRIKESDGVREEVKIEAERRAEKEAAAERSRLLGEERKRIEEEALIGPYSFEDFERQEVDKADAPILAEINKVRELQARLMTAVDSMPLLDRKELETRYAHDLDGLYRKLTKERADVRKKLADDRTKLTESLHGQMAGIDAFEADLKADVYTYEPDDELHPEMAALIAGANGEVVGGDEEPAYVDEYDIKHEKGHPTRMQRLVYRTENPGLFIIEDWDKTSGKLKRQSLVKGTNVLIPAKENGAKRLSRGRSELELSNAVYQKLGPINPRMVSADADTSSSDGYGGYVRNLTRTGGVGISKARELANPSRSTNTRTEGFISLLIKNLEQNSKKR